jgi:hypothetical protein
MFYGLTSLFGAGGGALGGIPGAILGAAAPSAIAHMAGKAMTNPAIVEAIVNAKQTPVFAGLGPLAAGGALAADPIPVETQ